MMPNEQNTAKTALLLVNLGSPDAPDAGAVRRYLVEFLSDPRVVDLPRWVWLPLLKLVIGPLRGRRSARAYRKIWTEQGSPLVVLTLRLAEKVQRSLRLAGSDVLVEVAMRYGQPDVAGALARLQDTGIGRLIVLPLYPQFSATTTESSFDAVRAYYEGNNKPPAIRFVKQYFDVPAWSLAIADSINAWWCEHGRADVLLFSFHGLPERYIAAGDPYRDQCEQSVQNIVKELKLDDSDYLMTYQSRVGAEKWLEPYTDKELIKLAESGTRRVQVVCPGFSIDCLETLEEIAMQNRDFFLAAGGETLEYIPALNDSDTQVDLVLEILREETAD